MPKTTSILMSTNDMLSFEFPNLHIPTHLINRLMMYMRICKLGRPGIRKYVYTPNFEYFTLAERVYVPNNVVGKFIMIRNGFNLFYNDEKCNKQPYTNVNGLILSNGRQYVYAIIPAHRKQNKSSIAFEIIEYDDKFKNELSDRMFELAINKIGEI